MHGRKHRADTDWGGKLQYLTALLRDLERTAQESPGGSGSQDDDQLRVDQCELCFQPGQAGPDVGDLRCGVNSSLASFSEAKVLDGIGDVHLLFGYVRLVQCLLEKPPCRPNERNALAIFDVAGLLADQSQRCSRIAG